MKEIILMTNKYNKTANAQMIDILQTLDKEILYKDMGLFEKSIIGVVAHYTSADASFFGDYFARFCATPPESNVKHFLKAPFVLNDEYLNNPQKLFEARAYIDKYITEVVENINDYASIKSVAFPWGEMSKPVYQFILSILNHAIHHRGMIAAALDILKIENDFNGRMLAL
ncbi:DinB family protein [uncultured Helicobacter sp.]|uniref:DinB family protein n=1 Tax=uncultured Helicobacter sp. TaxID=175537 RepID=UPI00258BC0ED|nr:DinB family protein [uncultured Helicobacter sp.]